MNATLRRRFEMADRVRDFLRAHRPEGVAEGAALARLEALIERANARGAQQRDGLATERGSTQHRAKVRRALQTTLLKYLAGVAAVTARDHVGFGEAFRLPRTRVTNQAFVTMVRVILEKATEEKELLVSRGMSEDLLSDLASALAEFEQTLEATGTGRRNHVGASADLAAVASEMTQQVRLLDGLVRYRFGSSSELMAAWASARNVVGPVRSHGEQKQGGVAPAA